MKRAWVAAAGLLLGCGSSSSDGGETNGGATNGGASGGVSAAGGGASGSGAGNVASAGNAGATGGAGGGAAGNAAAGNGGNAGSAGTAGSVGGTGGAANDPYAPTFDSQHGCRPNGPTLDQVAGARVLLTGTFADEFTAFTIFGGSLYYANYEKGIYRIPLPVSATPKPELVASTLDRIYLLFGGGDSIYSVQGNSEALGRYPLATLPATETVVLTGIDQRTLATDANNLYYSGSSIFELAFSGATAGVIPQTLLPNASAFDIAVSDSFLYYLANSDSAYRIPVTGGTPEPLFSVGAPSELAVVAGTVYLTMTSHVLRWDPGGSFHFTTLASGSPILAGDSNDWGVEQLKADPEKVYYRESNGTLAWAKTDGSDCRIVVRLPSLSPDNNEWAMTDTHYYFITNQKQLNELPR